jgi:hypothetical protein
MCGRYARRSDKQKIAEHFAVHGPVLLDFLPADCPIESGRCCEKEGPSCCSKDSSQKRSEESTQDGEPDNRCEARPAKGTN